MFHKLLSPALLDLLRDQRLKDVLTRREFRITEEYLHREVVSRAGDRELQGLSLKLCDGYGEISGRVKKRLLPFPIPFSARFTVHAFDFGRAEKTLCLKMERVRPLDLEWVTGKVVDSIPFLSYQEGVVVCDLEKVPRLCELLSCRVKGVRPFDHVVLKDILVKEGEVVGRLGFSL